MRIHSVQILRYSIAPDTFVIQDADCVTNLPLFTLGLFLLLIEDGGFVYLRPECEVPEKVQVRVGEEKPKCVKAMPNFDQICDALNAVLDSCSVIQLRIDLSDARETSYWNVEKNKSDYVLQWVRSDSTKYFTLDDRERCVLGSVRSLVIKIPKTVSSNHKFDGLDWIFREITSRFELAKKRSELILDQTSYGLATKEEVFATLAALKRLGIISYVENF